MRPPRALFICTGNICRSFMAERLARKLAADRGFAVEVRSCGVAARCEYEPTLEALTALRAFGAPCEGHTARLVSRELLEWCDVGLGMTLAHVDAVARAFPQSASKVHLLTAYAGLPEKDVADPIGRPQAVYDACREELMAALPHALKKLTGGQP